MGIQQPGEFHGTLGRAWEPDVAHTRPLQGAQVQTHVVCVLLGLTANPSSPGASGTCPSSGARGTVLHMQARAPGPSTRLEVQVQDGEHGEGVGMPGDHMGLLLPPQAMTRPSATDPAAKLPLCSTG